MILLQRCRQLDVCIKISPGRYTVSVHCLNCLCPIIQRSCRTYRDVGPCSWTLLARAYDLQHGSRAADRSSNQSQGSISTRLGKGIKVPVVIPLLFPDNHPSSSSSTHWIQLSRDTTTIHKSVTLSPLASKYTLLTTAATTRPDGVLASHPLLRWRVGVTVGEPQQLLPTTQRRAIMPHRWPHELPQQHTHCRRFLLLYLPGRAHAADAVLGPAGAFWRDGGGLDIAWSLVCQPPKTFSPPEMGSPRIHLANVLG